MRLTRTSSMMISALIITIILAGCGVVATGVPSATNHARTAVPPEATYVILQSDTGDFIGGGQAFTYTLADTHINVSAMRGHLSVTIVDGPEIFKSQTASNSSSPATTAISNAIPFIIP